MSLKTSLTKSRPPCKQALLSLGSNLGDRSEYLLAAARALAAHPDTHLLAISPFLETAPVDCPADSPPFLNAAAAIETSLTPEELLAVTDEIETANGRTRSLPNAPRTLDIDLLFYENETRSTPLLTLPHPRWHERQFVRQPLATLLATVPLDAETRWDFLREALANEQIASV
jgi:2-amino-4-hydroxy-6-hydroxymethyldihydropteridine diphosphokinase